MSIAWVFPGQGSQKVGMSGAVMNLPGSSERFEMASAIIGRDLFKICSGQQEEINEKFDLNDTRNTQPALFVVESLLVDDLLRQGRKASFVAGHSLGEIVALYAAEVFDAEAALHLLHRRSELMFSAGDGGMTAVVGFDRNELEKLVANYPSVVIANDNSDAQVVLSGSKEDVTSVSQQIKCKRAIPLPVSGAFHSPFMQKASEAFSEELDKVDFQEASIPVLSNSDPRPTTDPILIKNRLKKQMISGVRWRETMQVLAEQGITNFVEIGPGNVLSGLAKRALTDVSINQVSSAIDLGH